MHAFAQKGPEYLAWGTFEASSEEPGGLGFVGSQRVRQDCAHMPREERATSVSRLLFCGAAPQRFAVFKHSGCHSLLPQVFRTASPRRSTSGPLLPPTPATVLSPRENRKSLRPTRTPGPCLLCPSQSLHTPRVPGGACWSEGVLKGWKPLSFPPSSRGPSAKAFSSSTCFLH